MKNISNFINEKLKVNKNFQELPTWKEFTEALYHFHKGRGLFKLEYLDKFKNAQIADYPNFIESDNDKFPKAGHIMELLADYNTKREQSIIIYFKYKRVPDNYITIRMYEREHEELIKSLGEQLYIEIYEKMTEQL
jgi:hypothetical protein